MNAQQAKQVNMWREELLRQKKILIENGNKISEEDQQQLLLNYSKMLEIIETPVCVNVGCNCPAAKNEYYPNSGGGMYWTLCEQCYQIDQEE